MHDQLARRYGETGPPGVAKLWVLREWQSLVVQIPAEGASPGWCVFAYKLNDCAQILAGLWPPLDSIGLFRRDHGPAGSTQVCVLPAGFMLADERRNVGIHFGQDCIMGEVRPGVVHGVL